MITKIDRFRDCFFFNEEGKITDEPYANGHVVGFYIDQYIYEHDGNYGEKQMKSRVLYGLVAAGDGEGIIAFLKREIPDCMAEVLNHTYDDFMDGFIDGYILSN